MEGYIRNRNKRNKHIIQLKQRPLVVNQRPILASPTNNSLLTFHTKNNSTFFFLIFLSIEDGWFLRGFIIHVYLIFIHITVNHYQLSSHFSSCVLCYRPIYQGRHPLVILIYFSPGFFGFDYSWILGYGYGLFWFKGSLQDLYFSVVMHMMCCSLMKEWFLDVVETGLPRSWNGYEIVNCEESNFVLIDNTQFLSSTGRFLSTVGDILQSVVLLGHHQSFLGFFIFLWGALKINASSEL